MKNITKAIPVLKFSQLVASSNIAQPILEAYGSEGKGILFVKDTPGFQEARAQLLPLIWKLGTSDPATLSKYARPDISHSIGWSKGVQQFKGKFDVSKGSFYFRTPQDKGVIPPGKYSEQEIRLFTSQNKWPTQFDGFEANTKRVAALIKQTATLLAHHIDKYVAAKVPSYMPDFLYKTIAEGRDHVGRVLHYYPVQTKAELGEDWCGWHNDHSCFTGLMPAAFYDKEGNRYKPQGTDGGLFAMTRTGDKARIQIPEDCVAFQTGQTLQIMSGGVIQATPHCVVSFEDIVGKGISRQTLAVFHQPGPSLIMNVPKQCNRTRALENRPLIPGIGNRYSDGMTFADFSVRTLKSYS